MRGVSKTFNLFSKYFGNEVPSYSSVRNWVFRTGLFLLKKPVEPRPDMIWILDHSIETGSEKLLAAVGIPLERLNKRGFTPKHIDVDLLELMPVKKSTGDTVYEQMQAIEERHGSPAQIVIDGGSDLKKGVELFREDHPKAIHTYDISHRLALLLKSELEHDKDWLEFSEAIAMTAKMVRQTNLLFLSPPGLRTKARYMNADLLVDWANKILPYAKNRDFSLISDSYELTDSILVDFQGKLSMTELCGAMSLTGETFIGKEHFLSVLRQSIGVNACEKYGEEIRLHSCKDNREFGLKLGWVSEFKEELEEFTQLMNIVEAAKKEVRKNGLNRETAGKVVNRIKQISQLTSRANLFQGRVIEAIKEEGSKIPRGVSMLGTSEVLESIFGKYKTFSSKRPIKTIGEMMLSIPLSLTTLSQGLVKQALESVSYGALKEWSEKIFGKSVLSQRILAFSEKNIVSA